MWRQGNVRKEYFRKKYSGRKMGVVTQWNYKYYTCPCKRWYRLKVYCLFDAVYNIVYQWCTRSGNIVGLVKYLVYKLNVS